MEPTQTRRQPAATGTVRGVAIEDTLPPPGDAAVRSPAGALDAESRLWLHHLAGSGHAHDDAVRRLHELLLRAALYEVSRRRNTLRYLRGGDHDDLAQQAADDALVAVLGKLSQFRGDSRFTTWAYKFALYEAAVRLRRRAWQDRELPLEPDAWPAFASRALSPGEHLAESELLAALRVAIAERLSAHQREVLVAVTLNGIPIDVLAERLNTTRGALYKTLHDARKKLRSELAADGFDIADGEREQYR
jgi:RNA polymerase sigma-70 factor (ECF subfamily)